MYDVLLVCQQTNSKSEMTQRRSIEGSSVTEVNQKPSPAAINFVVYIPRGLQFQIMYLLLASLCVCPSDVRPLTVPWSYLEN